MTRKTLSAVWPMLKPAIPIEERDPDELLFCGGGRLAPPGCAARNPVFDITPAALVDAIVTEQGVVLQPDAQKIRTLMA